MGHDKKEILRLKELYQYESALYEDGIQTVSGVDEVGRGPLAGPVVACALVLPKNLLILGVNDSKKLSPKKRENLFVEITRSAVDYAIGVVNADVIDEINILKATYEAMRNALMALTIVPGHVLVDAVCIPGISIPQTAIVKGDAKSHSIAAASIVAKVLRDRMMEDYDKLYPEYGFASHKGYGTRRHIEAIEMHGLCPIHRKTFTTRFEKLL